MNAVIIIELFLLFTKKNLCGEKFQTDKEAELAIEAAPKLWPEKRKILLGSGQAFTNGSQECAQLEFFFAAVLSAKLTEK